MNDIILLHKLAGYTPLQAIHAVREQYPEYQNLRLSYAGRLDPMAEGLLIILVGDENKKRLEYLNLSKTYEFEVVYGVSTDTYDVMGKITSYTYTTTFDIDLKSGIYNVPYPPYSSKAVNGKPLFWYAKNNLLSTIDIPRKEIIISEIRRVSSKPVSNQEIYTSIKKRILMVDGDFRQTEILDDWKKFFEKKQTPDMQVSKYIASVSTGTYIRGIVHDLELQSGIPLLTYTIRRTQIGNYSINDAIQLPLPE